MNKKDYKYEPVNRRLIIKYKKYSFFINKFYGDLYGLSSINISICDGKTQNQTLYHTHFGYDLWIALEKRFLKEYRYCEDKANPNTPYMDKCLHLLRKL